MLKLITHEAGAYLRLGLLSPSWRRLPQRPRGRARLGVLFVPGVGANGSQFLRLKHALGDVADAFFAFEYFSLRHPERVAAELAPELGQVAGMCDRVVVIGHSLGGLLLRMVLQAPEIPPNVLGYVSICAPLHGTWRSRIAPSRGLRALAPDSPLLERVLRDAGRLDRLEGRILTVGARHDQMIRPHTSAFLDSYPTLEVANVAHAGSLLDAQVLDRVSTAVTAWSVSSHESGFR